MPRHGTAQPDGAVRSRYLVPRDAPRYRELVAALAVAALLVHLLLAQLTLLLAAAMYMVGQASRWRPQWLAAPAGLGLLWTLAIGVPRAASGLAAGPRHVLGYLAGIGGHPGHLLTLPDAFGGLSHWLPEQFPLALMLAAAEALGLCWLRWHVSGRPEWRTGLIVATRRWLMAAWLRSGGVVTRDGAMLGVDNATGRPAAISWREAEGGVLCADAAQGFTIALAAIRRRKPVIVIDLAGSRRLAEALAAACREPHAPLSVFGQDGPGCYDPLRGGDPARAATMITAMIDWSNVTDQHRRSCVAYLADALAVQAAAPGDRGAPVLDDLITLLTPDGLRERAAQVPGYHPRRSVLSDRAAVSASLLQADPATTAAAVEQLGNLRASALGPWLRPPSPDAGPATTEPSAVAARAPVPSGPVPSGPVRISLGRTVRERAVTLFSLDRAAHGDATRMIAALAAADLVAVASELEDMSISGDSLAWVNGFEVLGPELIGQLIAKGPAAGMSVVLSTTSAPATELLAARVSVLAAESPVDPALASRFAGPDDVAASSGIAGLDGVPGQDGTAGSSGIAAVLANDTLGRPGAARTRAPGAGAFALLVRGGHGAQPRYLAHCRSVRPDGLNGSGRLKGRPGLQNLSGMRG